MTQDEMFAPGETKAAEDIRAAVIAALGPKFISEVGPMFADRDVAKPIGFEVSLGGSFDVQIIVIGIDPR